MQFFSSCKYGVFVVYVLSMTIPKILFHFRQICGVYEFMPLRTDSIVKRGSFESAALSGPTYYRASSVSEKDSESTFFGYTGYPSGNSCCALHRRPILTI